MDESVVKVFEQQQVGKLKLSEAVRAAGYTNGSSYGGCVLACAYRLVTGRELSRPGMDAETEEAARHFNVPFSVARKAEVFCMEKRPAAEIADWLESQGL
jgi:hypothetical protein